MIPEGGRDVQCSNCGHAWFQRPAGWENQQPDSDPDLATRGDEIAPDDPVPEPDPDPSPEPDAETPEPVARPRRPLDEGVRGILEEEAQRELRARESEGMETQPDLGIDAARDTEEERRRIARERMARMRGIGEGEALEPEVAPPPPEPEPEPRPRKELFPDIEEINSTLDTPPTARPAPQRPAPREDDIEPAPPVRKRSGFARGFSIVVILVGLALAVYALAPTIVGYLPALGPALTAYVAFVNELLVSIDALMQTAIEKMEAAAGGEG